MLILRQAIGDISGQKVSNPIDWVVSYVGNTGRQRQVIDIALLTCNEKSLALPIPLA
jgi:hypothetical protein